MIARRAVVAAMFLLVATACAPAAEAPDARSEPAQALSGFTGSPATDTWTPWPQALHDAQHSGATAVTGPQTGRIRWTRELEGNVTPGPVVGDDGTIYAASNAGVLHALDPGTGEDRWTVDGRGSYGIDQSTSPAVLPDGTILWPGPGGRLFAVSPRGDVLWSLDLDGLVSSPAVRADGSTVVGTSSGLLVALRPTARGPAEQWRLDLDDQSYGSPVWSEDGTTVYQSLVSAVVAVRDGSELWRAEPARDIIEVSPALAPDGTVVIGSNDDRVYGLDPADGSTRWNHDLGFTTYSSPSATRDGLVYIGDHGNRLTGLEAATGRQVFSFQGSRTDDGPGGIGVWTSVLVDGDHTVYAGTRQGLVYGVDRSGKLLWTIDAGSTVDSYPALTADGALVIGVSDGRLLAIADG